MKKLEGGCLCGEVEYVVNDSFLYAGYCHCSQCRQFSGASGSAIGGIAASDFSIGKGEASITKFKKTEDSILCFCSKCGSSLYGEKPKTGLIHVRYGSLREAPGLAPQAHMHTSSKASWYEIEDDLPQFPESPPV